MVTESIQPTDRPSIGVLLAIVACYALLGWGALLARSSIWELGWAYVGLFIAANVVFTAALLIWNADLAWRRGELNPGTKRWDWVWLAAFVTSLLAVLVVAVHEFDIPAHRVDPPGPPWHAGLVLYVAGWVLFTWAGVSNPFFEKTVRIQTESHHRVVDWGPYAVVRHPGYVGFIATWLATPPLLPGFWTGTLSLVIALLLVIRTALEDRTLIDELPGYADYAARVRSRLVPGVW